MHKYLKIALFSVLLLAAALAAHLALPSSTPLALPAPPPSRQHLLLAPLDSRPVCSTMVQKLGQLAGLNVILPPKAFLDNYQTPAKQEKLLQWLAYCTPYYEHSIISADLLLHGGLLAARRSSATEPQEDALLTSLDKLHAGQKNGGSQAIFSIIPRLLVSDQLLPDRWYQYQLWRYSQLADMVRISGSFYLTQKLRETEAKIPPKVLNKYQQLYKQSDRFNEGLLQLAHRTPDLQLVIGQDDASPIGLPHASASRIASRIEGQRLATAQLTYGADELATLLLVRYYLAKQAWQPKVCFMYAAPQTEQKTMPYTPAAVSTVLRSQLMLIGAAEAAAPEEADLVCYINCGDDDLLPGTKQIEAVRALLNAGRPVALVDSSANFAPAELLLPKLLNSGVPVNRLAAYAGWNTFSNSSGTALAQGLIFAGRLRELRRYGGSEAQYASLYADNLSFTAERILEDYYYQKLLHPSLRHDLEVQGIDPTDLSPAAKQQTTEEIQSRIALDAFLLLHENLGQTPFYEHNGSKYYLRNLFVSARLPWSRIFEVELTIWPHIGVSKAKE